MSKHTLHTIIRILLLPVFTAVAVCTAAQKDAVPYECGFEQADAECGNWVLNYNPAVTGWSNRWYIGGAVAAEGAQSMYIRPSAIDSAKYVSKENTMLAWRVFDLPYGDYNVAFDWMAMGFNGARLLVSWVDNEANLQRIVSVNSGYLAPEILDSCHISDADGIALDSLCGSGVWQRAFTTVHSDGTKRYKLIFAWYNSGQGRPVPPAACIDNIEIVEVGCSHPQNLKATVSGATAELSWQADADSYDVWYRRHGQTNWTKRTSATNSFRLPGQVNGIYEVKVRAHCGDKTSVWSATKRVLVYSGLCLDYLDLDAAECRSGLVAEVVKGGGTPGVVDHGFESGVSRHTLHFMPGETDPRTDGILPTVPPGEIASVRLGNWGEKPRAHGESVTYRYPVDASVAKLLLLKYAVVFQRPDPDHDRNAQPHFRLRIFNDKTGEQVDPDCAGAEFYAGYGSGADWITIDRSSPTATQKDILEVKPWTTLGINLAEHDGDTLRIEIANLGCGMNAHFAYSYFTLGCESGKLDGIKCGEHQTNEFIAPKGFDYRWYYKGDKTNPGSIIPEDKIIVRNGVKMTGDTFPVLPNDERDYCVDVIYPENDNCFFTLNANATPRFPKAEAQFEVVKRNCRLFVRCKSNSYVYNKFGKVDDEPLQTIQWALDASDPGMMQIVDGVDTCELEIPNDGEQHTVTLSVGINVEGDEGCFDSDVFTLKEPVLQPVEKITPIRVCIPADELEQAPTLPDSRDTIGVDECGCIVDSVSRYYYSPINDTAIYATTCSDRPYEFLGETYNKEGEYVIKTISSGGCDSLITLHLSVTQAIEASVAPGSFAFCADDSMAVVPFEIVGGVADSVTIAFAATDNGLSGNDAIFADGVVQVPIPQPAMPSVYPAVITAYNSCGEKSFAVDVIVNYPDSIVEQKWNDVLAVLNDRYNGGYRFTAFQWMKNGTPLPGENRPYLYIDNTDLDSSALYSVRLTRASDLQTLPTCDIRYLPRAENRDGFVVLRRPLPSSALCSSQVPVASYSPCQVNIYTISGALVASGNIAAGGSFSVPSVAGMYLVQITSANGRIVQKLRAYK